MASAYRGTGALGSFGGRLNPFNYDFGISELIGGNVTPQGGSNLFGSNPQSSASSGSNNTTNSSQLNASYLPNSSSSGGFGSVLGATTGSGSTNNTVPTNAPQSVSTNINQGGQGVNLGDVLSDDMRSIYESFDNILGDLPGSQDTLNKTINNTKQEQITGINQQLQGELSKFPTYEEQIRKNQATSLAELAQDLRDQTQNAVNFLSSRGAAGTSANPMVQYALQKEFGKNRADIRSQGSQQLQELGIKEIDLKNKASEMINQVETWASGQIANIAAQFDELKRNTELMKTQAGQQAKEQLFSYLAQVDAQRRNYNQAIQQSALERLQMLNNMKIELGQLGNYNPQDIVMNEINALQGLPGGGVDPYSAVGGFGFKKDENQLG